MTSNCIASRASVSVLCNMWPALYTTNQWEIMSHANVIVCEATKTSSFCLNHAEGHFSACWGYKWRNFPSGTHNRKQSITCTHIHTPDISETQQVIEIKTWAFRWRLWLFVWPTRVHKQTWSLHIISNSLH